MAFFQGHGIFFAKTEPTMNIEETGTYRRPTEHSCAELGVCQTCIPACQGCEHESAWRMPKTRWERVVSVWRRWRDLLLVVLALGLVAATVVSAVSLGNSLALSYSNSQAQDKGYVEYLQDKLILFILREEQLKKQLEIVSSQCPAPVVAQGAQP
jgi:hypothetical protein